MLEPRIGLSPEHSSAHSTPTAIRSPQEVLTQFLSGPESRELHPTERRELAALSRERDAELFHSGLLHLAGRVENRDSLTLAAQLYSMVQSQSQDPHLRSRAQSRLALLEGRGNFGDRFEFQAQRFFGHSTEPIALASMALGGAAFRAARLGMLGRLLSSSSANWVTRGLGARVLANGGAFLAESMTFVLAGRGLSAMGGRTQDWSFRSLGQEWAAGAITLASLRGFGAAGSGIYRRVHGATASPWQALYAQTAMFGGILAAHQVETRLGLRQPTEGSNALVDGLVTLLQFNVAGRILREGLGPRWQAWEQGLDRSAASLSWNFSRPSGPASGMGGLGPVPAFAGNVALPARQIPLRQANGLVFMEGRPGGEPRPAEVPANGAGDSVAPVEGAEKPPSWWPPGDIRPETVREFIDTLPDTTVVLEFVPSESGEGLVGRIRMANSRIQEKFGYTPEETVDMPLSRFTRSEDAATMTRMQRMILNSGRIKFQDVPFVRKDGSVIYCDVRGNAQQLGDRTIGFAILQDVSKRRQAQAQIQTERARFRALLKGVPDVMLRITREGEIVDAHYERPENFIIPLQSIIGKQVANFPAPPHLIQLAMDTIHTALETGEPQLREYVLPMPDGSQRIQEGRMMRSGPDEIVATIRDVTEARQAEGHRIAAARAEVIKLMGRGLAHDLNNALVPLVMITEHSLKTLEKLQRGDRILASDELETLIQDQRSASEALSRIRGMITGFRELSTEPANGPAFDLNELINPVALRATVGANVELRVNRSAEASLVPGPRQNIQRVIQNLVGNANDAMEGRQGLLRIEVDRVVLSVEDLRRMGAPDTVNRNEPIFTRLRVQDSGSGISSDHLPRIFEPYFSTKKNENEAGHGGLGLAITQKLVQDAGGFITVESYPSVGTTFDVHLPNVRPLPPTLTARQNLPEIHAKAVLVVSPDSSLHDSVQAVLGGRGFSRILFAPSVEQAMELAAAEPGGIGALLTDFRLPGNTYGIKLMHTLQATHPNLPSIIWTEHDASAYVNLGGTFGKVMERSGINSDLVPALEELLDRRLQHRD